MSIWPPNHTRFTTAPAAPDPRPPKSEFILRTVELPSLEIAAAWGRLLLDPRHLAGDKIVRALEVQFALAEEGLRAKLGIQGAALFHGPPGTGKTSAATGAPNALVQKLNIRGAVLVEVNTHALPGSERGACQRNVIKLFQHLDALAANASLLFVVINELETLATERRRISAETNPLDTSYGVNAFIESKDRLASRRRNVFLIATTNLPETIDAAIFDRFDDVFEFQLPGRLQRLQILLQSVEAMPNSGPAETVLRLAIQALKRGLTSRGLVGQADRESAALMECEPLLRATKGFSPRKLTHVPPRSLGVRTDTINAPLTLAHLIQASQHIRSTR